jgi:hypothetical protein
LIEDAKEEGRPSNPVLFEIPAGDTSGPILGFQVFDLGSGLLPEPATHARNEQTQKEWRLPRHEAVLRFVDGTAVDAVG